MTNKTPRYLVPSERMIEFGIVHKMILDLRKLNDLGYATMYDGHYVSQFSAPDIARVLIDTFTGRMPRDEQEKYRPMTEYLGSLFPEARHISIFEADQSEEPDSEYRIMDVSGGLRPT